MEDNISKELTRLFRYIILLNSVKEISIIFIVDKDSLSLVLIEKIKNEEEKFETTISNLFKKPEKLTVKEIDILCKKLHAYRERYNL